MNERMTPNGRRAQECTHDHLRTYYDQWMDS